MKPQMVSVSEPPEASSAQPSIPAAAALARMDLSGLKAVALDETASKRRHRYVTVFVVNLTIMSDNFRV